MRQTSWSGWAAVAILVTLGVTGPVAAEEPADVIAALETASSSPPEPLDDAESRLSQAHSPSTDSAGLPAPADDIEIPPDRFTGSAGHEAIVVTVAPRPVRRPRHLP